MSVKARRYPLKGEDRWEVDVFLAAPDAAADPDYRKRKRGFRTKAAAVAWGTRHERQVLLNGPKDKEEECPTINELLEPYLERAARLGGRKGLSGENWIERQRSAYRTWVGPTIGAMKAKDVSTRALDSLQLRMAEAGRKPRTIRNTLSAAKGLLEFAKWYGHIDLVPSVPPVSLDSPERPVHSFEDATHLVGVAQKWNDPASLPVALLGLDAGLRAGEILALTWDAIDLERGLLHVRGSVTAKGTVKAPKTDSSERTVPLTGRLKKALICWRATAPVGVSWLFAADGKPVTHKWLKVRVLPVLRIAGLTESSPLHALRRTFCTQARLREIPELQVQRWMGHKSARSVTDLYTGEFPLESQTRWMQRLEEPPHGVSEGLDWRDTGELGIRRG